MNPWETDERSIWRGLVAGIAGGLAATWVMTRAQGAMSDFMSANSDNDDSDESTDDPTTVKAADQLTHAVTGRHLREGEKDAAGMAMHWAFGAIVGAVYGVLAELQPRVTMAGGVPYGAAVWLVADEGVLPLSGLSKAPTEYPLSTHASGLGAHVIYGGALESARRGIRAAL